MKQLAAVTALSLVLSIPALAQMNLKGLTSFSKTATSFSSSHELLPSPVSAPSTVSHGTSLPSSKSLLTGPGSVSATPAHMKGPACPEPTSIAALTIGLASIVRRRKAARA